MIHERSTGVTAISQSIVNTMDYICGSLLIHHTHDNTVMSELAREATVAPYSFWMIIIINNCYIVTF